MAKVSVQIVTWNSMRYIFDCLESLMHQSFRDFSILVIDNASDDGTVEFLRTHYPNISILQNFKNLGYCKANNQGIKLAKTEYVLVMNADVVLTENFLEKLVNFADNHFQGGSFGGKLLKLYTAEINPAEAEGGMREMIKSDVIDSTSLQIYKNRFVANRGEGQKDIGQYDRAEEVFGISGACVLYRRQALEEVKIKEDYFDSDFFVYKEDIDLAWRLRLYGWQAYYLPEAVVYHHRRFSRDLGRSWRKLIKSRRKVSRLLRSLSFKNQHLVLVKNDQPINLLLHFFPFVFREFKILVYGLIFEPFLWKRVIEFFRQLPCALFKRRIIMAHRKVSTQEIRKWMK